MLMHSAPWTKHSVSMPQPRVIAAISSRLSSRARMTRAKPRSAISSAPSRVWTLIWVEAWRGRPGAICRHSSATAMSWQMTASAPLAATARTAPARASSSPA